MQAEHYREMASYNALIHKFSAPNGYRVWNRLIRGWKLFATKLDFLPPKCGSEVLSMPFWWTIQFYIGNFGISTIWANAFARARLLHFQDLWDPTSLQIYNWETICTKLLFKPDKHRCYTCMVNAIPEQWLELLTTQFYTIVANEFIGIFT